MYRTSCIIYVCSFSYAQKPDVPSIGGSLRRKHVGTRRRKPNNNKQVFSVTNSSHFGTNKQKGLFSGLSTAGGLKLVPLFFVLFFTVFFPLCLSFSLHIRLMREVFFFLLLLYCMCGFQESLGVQFWQGDRELSPG